MRSLLIVLAIAPRILAQVYALDPEYVVPHENPFASPSDVQTGERIFLAQCAGCHGPKGEGGRGAVLAHPRLRHAPDDEALFRVIRDGISGTDMPGGYALDTRETWQVAAYVRGLGRVAIEVLPGDPARGEKVYREKGHCAQCHIVAGEGRIIGPELTDIGARRSPAHLRQAILAPASALPENFRQVRIVQNDGRTFTGVRLNEDTFTIQIRDLNGRMYSFLKADLKELHADSDKTPMPSFRQLLSAAETDDLVAWLATRRGEP